MKVGVVIAIIVVALVVTASAAWAYEQNQTDIQADKTQQRLAGLGFAVLADNITDLQDGTGPRCFIVLEGPGISTLCSWYGRYSFTSAGTFDKFVQLANALNAKTLYRAGDTFEILETDFHCWYPNHVGDIPYGPQECGSTWGKGITYP